MDRKAKLEELRAKRNQQQSLLNDPIEIKHRNFNPTTQTSITSFDLIPKESGIIKPSKHPLLQYEEDSEDLTRILLSKYDRLANRLNRKILRLNESDEEKQDKLEYDEQNFSGLNNFNDDDKIEEYDEYLKPSMDMLLKKTNEKIRGLSKLRVREVMNKIND